MRIRLPLRPLRFGAAACALAGVLAGVGGFGGCATSPQTSGAGSESQKRPELRCARKGSERSETSSIRDGGRPDVVRLYASDGGALLCREVDLNGDGRKDMVVYYEPGGQRQREEIDHDYDGVIDIRNFFEQGRMVRQEVDTNNDGKADEVHHYDGSRLLRVETLTPPAAAPAAAGSSDAAPAAAAPAAPAAAAAPSAPRN